MTRTPSAGRTVARNTVFLFAAQITLRLLGFVPVILLANYLGVEGYGLYNFAIAFATLFILTWVCLSLLGRWLTSLFRRGGLGGLDRFLGAGVGTAKAI